MNIFHFAEGIPLAEGITTFVVCCAEAQQRQGHNVAIVVRRYNPEADQKTEVPIVVWNLNSSLQLPFQPSVAHIHTLWTPWALRAYVWNIAQHLPFVVSAHGNLTPWSLHHKRWKKFPVWWLCQRWLMRKATLLHSTAPMETQDLRNLGFTQPVVEAPLGTEVPNFCATHDAPIKWVAYIGRVYVKKGLDLFLRTWAQLKQRIPGFDWHFVAIGPDTEGYQAELTDLAQHLGLSVGNSMDGSTDIVFVGPRYGADKDRTLAQARLSVLPSYSENFGGVVLDALALGIPVLASDATPWDNLASHGCGEQHQLSESSEYQVLEKWLSLSDAERRTAGQRGRDWVIASFSWDEVARRLLKAYEGIITR